MNCPELQRTKLGLSETNNRIEKKKDFKKKISSLCILSNV